MEITECIKLLRSCSGLSQARKLHAHISASSRLSEHSYLAFLLMELYASFGSLKDVRRVFDGMTAKTSFALSTMLKASSSNVMEAKALFDGMPQLHDHISCTTMVSVYGLHGRVEDARSVFEEVRHPDVPLWNAMISCFARNGYPGEARGCFEKMAERNVVSWTALVTAYAQNGYLGKAQFVFNAMPRRNAFSWNTMVSSYGDSGQLGLAKDMFDRMPERTLVSVNSMLAAYAYNTSSSQAQIFFERMPKWNAVSWNTTMTAFAESGDVEQVKLLFDKIPEKTIVSWNLMLNAYTVKDCYLDCAQQVFHEMPLRDEVSWVTIIHGYARYGHFDKATSALDRMPQWNVIAWNALLGGYSQLGHVWEAQHLFDKMPERDIVSWTAVLSGYAQAGQPTTAFALLMLMHLEGVQPSHVPFLCILLVCNHVGSIKLGRSCFLSMRSDHGIEPSKDHYFCMVDLLARAGHLDDAEDLLNNMPFLPSGIAWDALLGACRNAKDVDRAKRAAKSVLELETTEDVAGSYMLLAGTLS